MSVDRDAARAVAAVSPVIPVAVISDLDVALPLVDALIEGGVPIIEVTLRTPGALTVIEQIASARPEMLVGAGTVLTAADVTRCVDAGARFLVSPGLTADLTQALVDAPVPALPGVATLSEAMNARDAGFRLLKFFPAAASGGIDFLRSVAGPIPDVGFCPTGGIGPDDYLDYLELPNVECVGGSWIVPSHFVAEGDWAGVRALASAVARTRH